MTLDEARRIALVISKADSGRPCCVKALVDDLNLQFPEFRWRLPKGYDSVQVRERLCTP